MTRREVVDQGSACTWVDEETHRKEKLSIRKKIQNSSPWKSFIWFTLTLEMKQISINFIFLFGDIFGHEIISLANRYYLTFIIIFESLEGRYTDMNGVKLSNKIQWKNKAAHLKQSIEGIWNGYEEAKWMEEEI